MNFVKFPVNATNIFPIANTTKGGQYVTEFNLRTLDSVATDENVQYMIGPSFVHSERDFLVMHQSNATSFFPDQDISSSSTVLTIMPGRGIINGHFVELLAPIEIDLSAAHAEAVIRGEVLSGVLVVGLRAMYATERTIAGALLPETVINPDTYPNPEDHPAAMYEGIQVVILPKSEFVLPTDEVAWSDPSAVTAHIKLAELTYVNGTIKGLANNYPQKCISIPANRVGNVSSNSSDANNQSHSEFISKAGLDPRKLYVYGGWSAKRLASGEYVPADTWCNGVPSLMLWDANPQLVPQDEWKNTPEARFSISGDSVSLFVPHQQPDVEGNPHMYNQDGKLLRYQTKEYQLPVADYDNGTPGIVNKKYTEHVKAVADQIHNFYTLGPGKQRGYLETLDFDPDTQKRQLPPIGPNWNIGDYIIVGTDNTVATETQVDTSNWIRNPSTMYVIVGGVVTQLKPQAEPGLGMQLGVVYMNIEDSRLNANGGVPNLDDAAIYQSYFDIEANQYHGTVGQDYFVLKYEVLEQEGSRPIYPADDPETEQDESKVDTPIGYEPIMVIKVKEVYFLVDEVSPTKTYTEPPIMLTGQLPLASTDQIGGFISVDESNVGNGYVRIDENGNLVLVDYNLLVSGVLAYQLGEDFDCPAGFSYSEIQSWLDEYINQRVAFPTANHILTSKLPNVIFINLTLSASDEPVTLNIGDIDSRFGTSICLNIYGNANSNTTINISNCEKIRIGTVTTSESGDAPRINLNRCNLYYDASIISVANSIENLRLWYEKYPLNDSENISSLPDLLVDGLTVSELGVPMYWQNFSLWTEDITNDNHYSYTLKSITLDPQGHLAACGVFVKTNTTFNNELGKTIFSRECKFPRGNSLIIPETKATTPIKISGTFVSTYSTNDTSNTKQLLVADNQFTMILPYNERHENPHTGEVTNTYVKGKFHCLADAYYVSATDGLSAAHDVLDGWQAGTYHMFTGHGIS